MPNYDVHLFPVVRFTVRGIEALVDVHGDEQYEHSSWLRPVSDGWKNARKPKDDVTAREPTWTRSKHNLSRLSE